MTTLSKATYFIIDCQTSGLSPISDQVVEVAWQQLYAGRVVADQSYLVKLRSATQWSKASEKLTGLSFSDLKNKGYTQRFVRSTLAKSLAQLPKESVIVCHFSSFEKRFLLPLLRRKYFGKTVLCTHRLAQIFYPDSTSYTLKGLAFRFGYLGLDLKRSRDHVEATKLIWSQIEARALEQGIKRIEELYERCTQKISRQALRRSYTIDRLLRLDLPEGPGVYRFYRKDGRLLYVGKAKNLKRRVNSYFQKRRKLPKGELLAQISDVKYSETKSEFEAILLEYSEIQTHQPPYNISLKTRVLAQPFNRSLQSTVSEGDVWGIAPLPKMWQLASQADASGASIRSILAYALLNKLRHDREKALDLAEEKEGLDLPSPAEIARSQLLDLYLWGRKLRIFHKLLVAVRNKVLRGMSTHFITLVCKRRRFLRI